MLATRPTLSWKYLPFLVSKALNNSVSPKTGFRPAEMVLGAEAAGASFLDLTTLAPPHFSVKSHKLYIEQLSAEFKLMTEVATKRLVELRLQQNERVNKNRIEKLFKPNDIVFVLDRTYIEGNPRVLRTTLNPSPYVVLRPLFKTSLVMRIADRYTTLYNNDDLKLFQGNSPLFQTLPPEVLKALLYKFSDLMEHEFNTITKFDPLRVPEGVELFVPDVPKEQANTNDGTINLFGDKPEDILGADYLRTIGDKQPAPSGVDEEQINPSTNKEQPAPLQEQDFQDLPEDDDGLDDDLEELLQSKDTAQGTNNDESLSEESEQEQSEDEEQGMKLRSGARKPEGTSKTVRFR